MALGLLIAAVDFSGIAADEFHDWLNLEHMPERQAIPGFAACERWISVDQPTHSVASYELDTHAVLDSATYKAIAVDKPSAWSKRVMSKCRLIMRFEGVQITPRAGNAMAPAGAGGLLLNVMNVAPEAEADFNAWYDEEHIPALASVPGTLAARRYQAEGPTGGAHRYVAMYHLTSANVPLSAAWKAAIATPWSARIKPHFRDRLRILSSRYTRPDR